MTLQVVSATANRRSQPKPEHITGRGDHTYNGPPGVPRVLGGGSRFGRRGRRASSSLALLFLLVLRICSWYRPAGNGVLLQPRRGIAFPCRGGLGQDSCCFLEGCGRLDNGEMELGYGSWRERKRAKRTRKESSWGGLAPRARRTGNGLPSGADKLVPPAASRPAKNTTVEDVKCIFSKVLVFWYTGCSLESSALVFRVSHGRN